MAGRNAGSGAFYFEALVERTKPRDERVRACVAGAAGSIDRSFWPRARSGLLRSRGNAIEEGTPEIQRVDRPAAAGAAQNY
jgi:hypothetical protein